MTARRFAQVDVFGSGPFSGNPVAVVLDADGIDDAAMAHFANWTNLSETTFVLPPTTTDADYRVRIFTPTLELPFAGHPTLGTCHAWLEAGGVPADHDRIVQQCGAGLVDIRRTDAGLAFAAPPVTRSGPLEAELLADVVAALGIAADGVVDSQWVDNGPGWLAVLLASAEDVLAIEPTFMEQDIGVVGPSAPGAEEAIEVRAFFPKDGAMHEDPVTGSLNASLAQWLTGSGRLEAPYVARQGSAAQPHAVPQLGHRVRGAAAGLREGGPERARETSQVRAAKSQERDHHGHGEQDQQQRRDPAGRALVDLGWHARRARAGQALPRGDHGTRRVGHGRRGRPRGRPAARGAGAAAVAGRAWPRHGLGLLPVVGPAGAAALATPVELVGKARRVLLHVGWQVLEALLELAVAVLAGIDRAVAAIVVDWPSQRWRGDDQHGQRHHRG